MSEAVQNKTQKPSRGLAYVLMGGHICVDAVQGGLAALIPFLVMWRGLSYAEAGALILACNIASAVIQPLFGWLGDKIASPWIMALGCVFSGVGMGVIGVLDSYAFILLGSLLAGIGIAMLHPEGGRLANLVGGDDKAVSMSIFSVGGQVGFCVGPFITVAAVAAFGLAGTLVYMLLCLPYAAFLLALNARFASFGQREAHVEQTAQVHNHWGYFNVVLGAVSLRSIIFYGLITFAPLLLVRLFGASEEFSSSTITIVSGVGAMATFASGYVARRINTPKLMVICYVVMVASFALFALSGSIAFCIALMVVIAVAMNIFNPPAITLAQGFVPSHLGMASGLTFGVAVCIGGITSPALGVFADNVGLVPVFWVLCACSVVGVGLALAIVYITRQAKGRF